MKVKVDVQSFSEIAVKEAMRNEKEEEGDDEDGVYVQDKEDEWEDLLEESE